MRKYWFRYYMNITSVTIMDDYYDMIEFIKDDNWKLINPLEIKNELNKIELNRLYWFDLYTNRLTDFDFLLNLQISTLRINI